MAPEPQRALEPEPESSLEERIRIRAYELYMERGCVSGNEIEDWLQAEQTLRAKKSKS